MNWFNKLSYKNNYISRGLHYFFELAISTLSATLQAGDLIDQVDRERGANKNQSRGIQFIHAKQLSHHPNTRYTLLVMDSCCHIISYHIVSYRIVSYRIVSYRIVSYRIVSYHIISYHIISYHIISYHTISYHIISYHIISYHIISCQCHVMSCLVRRPAPSTVGRESSITRNNTGNKVAIFLAPVFPCFSTTSRWRT